MAAKYVQTCSAAALARDHSTFDVGVSEDLRPQERPPSLSRLRAQRD